MSHIYNASLVHAKPNLWLVFLLLKYMETVRQKLIESKV